MEFCRPFFRLVIVMVVTLSLSTVTSAKTRPSSALDPGYLSALSSANRYLAAWQTGDVETGMALLTSHAKQNVTMDTLEKIFSAPGPLAYEIGRGKSLKRGRYEFPVFLVTAQTGGVRRRFSRIIVLTTGNNDWTVDKLP